MRIRFAFTATKIEVTRSVRFELTVKGFEVPFLIRTRIRAQNGKKGSCTLITNFGGLLPTVGDFPKMEISCAGISGPAIIFFNITYTLWIPSLGKSVWQDLHLLTTDLQSAPYLIWHKRTCAQTDLNRRHPPYKNGALPNCAMSAIQPLEVASRLSG
jgi:hypothetical protein